VVIGRSAQGLERDSGANHRLTGTTAEGYEPGPKRGKATAYPQVRLVPERPERLIRRRLPPIGSRKLRKGWLVRAVISLPAHPRSTRDARQFVCTTLHDWSLDDLSPEAELLASELVTNVVLHAGTAFEVALTHDDSEPLRVEVRDGSRRSPRRRRYSEEAATGRGMLLVESLALRHGVEVDDEGKRVWFELAPEVRAADDVHGEEEAS
jgi:anti-sigma regulatory factor (Ser/Thr protein kinase)